MSDTPDSEQKALDRAALRQEGRFKVGDLVRLRGQEHQRPLVVIGLEDYGNRALCQVIEVHSVADLEHASGK